MKVHIPPAVRQENGAVHLFVEGNPFTMLAGEVRNSSASSLEHLEPILDKLVRCNLNTVLAPVYWELLEPREGAFDFTLVSGMVSACRERGLKLVPLWFGTLKNATSCYTPEWVKTDHKRFPRAETTPGVPSLTISPLCQEVVDCDARAFARLMQHIGDIDAEGNTVILVQVENESGILNAPRDSSALANEAFAQTVPAELLENLKAREANLQREFRTIWERSKSSSGTWSDVFGVDADEIFMAWHTARLVEQVSAAGRAVCNRPMYTNAWLRHGPGYSPGMYPSGGPIPKMFDIWRAAAPSLDFLAPDIYRSSFRDNAASFCQPGNPLFVPEARNSFAAAANAIYTIGKHQGLGFSPFAIDDIDESHPLCATYAVLALLLAFLREHYPTARSTAFVQEADNEQWKETLGPITFCGRTVRALTETPVPGCGMLIHLGGTEFLCLGQDIDLTLRDNSDRNAELISLDVGTIVDGQWHHGRRLNGDETLHGTTVRMGSELRLCRFRIAEVNSGR